MSRLRSMHESNAVVVFLQLSQVTVLESLKKKVWCTIQSQSSESLEPPF